MKNVYYLQRSGILKGKLTRKGRNIVSRVLAKKSFLLLQINHQFKKIWIDPRNRSKLNIASGSSWEAQASSSSRHSLAFLGNNKQGARTSEAPWCSTLPGNDVLINFATFTVYWLSRLLVYLQVRCLEMIRLVFESIVMINISDTMHSAFGTTY